MCRMAYEKLTSHADSAWHAHAKKKENTLAAHSPPSERANQVRIGINVREGERERASEKGRGGLKALTRA